MKRSGLQLQEKFSLTWLLPSYIVCDFVIDFIICFRLGTAYAVAFIGCMKGKSLENC